MWYLILLFILGTVAGSFFNVCIHRLPRGESVVYPGSRCPQCGHKLGWLDLIPLFGYLLTLGKCRYCKKGISIRYPLVEIVTGLLFVAVALVSPFSSRAFEFIFYLIFTSLLVLIFFTDLEQQIIPDGLNFAGIFFGLAFNYIRGLAWSRADALNPFLSALYGMLLGYLLLYVIARIGEWLFKKEAIGKGDFYLAAFLGAYLGWQWLLLAVLLAYLIGGAISLMLLISGRMKMGEYIPFGPALVAGGIITLFFGDHIIFWYLKLFL